MADLPLNVLPGAPTGSGAGCGTPSHKPASHMGRWRAGVLLLVHAAFAVHIGFYIASGSDDGIPTTVTPVEPSESMFTLEQGLVNAGFVFFALALLSTLIFGRFFCGWGCHVVALQDLCGWGMKKIGVHPKPFRSRILLWAPLLLALYMFVWPTIRRDVITPLVGTDIDRDGVKSSIVTGLRESLFQQDLNGDGVISQPGQPGDFNPGVPESVVGRDLNGNDTMTDTLNEYAELPLWIGKSNPLPGFKPHFMTSDFWATFAHWTVAIPFLAVCGFVTVYFLGAKAYCSYGCPYGGFFAPLDRLSPFRIRVNEDCNACGHCTAVCTSNVRVHEEVRDYGAVVDPGCMKCLDCVSACPTDALRVGMGLPAAFTRPIDPQSPALAQARERIQKRYDLSLPAEFAIGGLFFAMLYGYRGMYGSVPLLFAMGIAMIVAFMAHKAWRALADRNVRAPFVQIKLDGRLKPAGYLFLLLTAGLLAVGVQGIAIKLISKPADATANRLTRADEAWQSIGKPYIPTEQDTKDARAAIDRLILAGSITNGGIAFFTTPAQLERLSYLYAYIGDNSKAEAALVALIKASEPRPQWIAGLMGFYRVRQADPNEAIAQLEGFQERWHDNDPIRAQRATLLININRAPQAIALYDEYVREHPGDITAASTAALVHLNERVNQPARAMEILRAALRVRPHAPILNERLAQAMLMSGQDPAAAAEILRKAAERQPTPQRWAILSNIYRQLGRTAEAEEAFGRARTLNPALPEPGAGDATR